MNMDECMVVTRSHVEYELEKARWRYFLEGFALGCGAAAVVYYLLWRM